MMRTIALPPLNLPGHLIKCAKRMDKPWLKMCPYNATHRVTIEDYNNHIVTCPDYEPVLFGKSGTRVPDRLKPDFKPELNPPEAHQMPTYEEWWEEDVSRFGETQEDWYKKTLLAFPQLKEDSDFMERYKHNVPEQSIQIPGAPRSVSQLTNGTSSVLSTSTIRDTCLSDLDDQARGFGRGRGSRSSSSGYGMPGGSAEPTKRIGFGRGRRVEPKQ
ncbi:hypothetical protein HDE_03214 [Halotydeus destructor]|nr:hypothetical protein HDE_03214 [Halotydeus destructor]